MVEVQIRAIAASLLAQRGITDPDEIERLSEWGVGIYSDRTSENSLLSYCTREQIEDWISDNRITWNRQQQALFFIIDSNIRANREAEESRLQGIEDDRLAEEEIRLFEAQTEAEEALLREQAEEVIRSFEAQTEAARLESEAEAEEALLREQAEQDRLESQSEEKESSLPDVSGYMDDEPDLSGYMDDMPEEEVLSEEDVNSFSFSQSAADIESDRLMAVMAEADRLEAEAERVINDARESYTVDRQWWLRAYWPLHGRTTMWDGSAINGSRLWEIEFPDTPYVRIGGPGWSQGRVFEAHQAHFLNRDRSVFGHYSRLEFRSGSYFRPHTQHMHLRFWWACYNRSLEDNGLPQVWGEPEGVFSSQEDKDHMIRSVRDWQMRASQGHTGPIPR